MPLSGASTATNSEGSNFLQLGPAISSAFEYDKAGSRDTRPEMIAIIKSGQEKKIISTKNGNYTQILSPDILS